LGGWARDHVVSDVLDRLNVLERDRPVASMSGGERRRIALARLLVARPTLAILDEPTNHLDAATIEWLETYLATEWGGAVLMVTHDRYVLEAICDRIVELDRGALQEYQGGYSDYLEQKSARLAHEARAESNRLNVLRRETAWLMRGAQARTTKQKARIQRAEALVAAEPPKPAARVELEGMEGGAASMGKSILDLDHVTLRVAEKTLVRDLDLHLVLGDRVGIIGPNGAGTTSLLRAVVSELAPSVGKLALGARTRVAFFDQSRALLRDDWSILDNIVEREGALRSGAGVVIIGKETIETRTYIEKFAFDASKQRQLVGSLSGGERARVALAKVLRSGANLLLLDEPTNDLDITTLAALEDLLVTWPGCVLVVSHDRYFLDRVATTILSFEADGRVVRYPGNYSTYLSLRPNALEAKRPSTSPAPTKKSTDSPAGPKALTYAERIELEGILDRVAAAEEKVTGLERELSDPTLYVTRGEDAKRLTTDLETARADVAALTSRWESLESRAAAKR
ncbi:MAG TPA: ABC-F family ATP-binding cassette domain-containing protein, partial [Polyangiaceae bacterium]|nr:ABC-F family ATP-binding cassette domain-containing protein [Polyangiaceae bacterium]